MDPGTLSRAYRRDRRRLVERLRGAGIEDLAVLHAFDVVPRHRFVPEAVRHRAYEDVALPLGYGQTISRPTVHALCLSLAELSGEESVLEVGTGSGFQTALLSTLVREVRSVEVVPELVQWAARVLAELEVHNVELRQGDGARGWPEAAPFDAILVAAAATEVPSALLDQLTEGGRLIVPVGDGGEQELRRYRKTESGWTSEIVDAARFVPLRRVSRGARG